MPLRESTAFDAGIGDSASKMTTRMRMMCGARGPSECALITTTSRR